MNKILDPDEMRKWLSSLWKHKAFNWLYAGINDDDCAIIEITKKQKIVITTDFLNNSPIGLELGISNYFDIGRLIVGSNISDLCGTGAIPKAFLLGLMFKKGSYENNYKEIIRGVNFELDKIKIPLIGGDSKLGKENSFYGIAIGTSNNKQKLFTKREAKPKDNLWVSGTLGNVSAAVYGLSTKIMHKEWETWAITKINEPFLPIEKSMKIANYMVGNGGTDISDGLGSDLRDMVQLSNVGVIIEPDLIPIDKHVQEISDKMKIPAWHFAFVIGGDFQFLVTSNSSNDELMNKIGMVRIGRIIEEPEYLIKVNNLYKPLPNKGHRDINKPSFFLEVKSILEDINNNLKD